MVGLPCSGKTTLARRLERECCALRLNPDEWQVPLFGQDAAEPEHDARHRLIEAMLWKIARRALELGTNVILDFGFWAREEREDFRLRAKQIGAASEIHFLDVPARGDASAARTKELAAFAGEFLHLRRDDAALARVFSKADTG